MNNRDHLLEQLDASLGSGISLGLLVVKVRKLGDVNAAYGHRVGDLYLEFVERMISDAVRETDIVGRMGDKEFGIILPGLKNPSIAVLAANKLLKLFADSVTLDDKVIMPDIAIGIVCSGSEDADQYDILTKAGVAVDKAQNASSRYMLYSDEEQHSLPSIVFENEILKAFRNDEFEMHFQPQIDLASGEVTGAEALIRWVSPTLGHVNTQLFVDALEESSIQLDVSKWVLNRSISQCAENAVVAPGFNLSVNISAALLSNPHIVSIASNAANIWDKAAASITIEVTESAMMANPECSKAVLEDFASRGFNISIDDFGTGYSSLEYLRDLPVSEMKIEKSFVMNMIRSSKDRKIVKAAIELAHAMELEVVAEGIEDLETREALLQMGCDKGQGYYIARPMNITQLQQWLEAVAQGDDIAGQGQNR